jgi:serine/threonine protein kinase
LGPVVGTGGFSYTYQAWQGRRRLSVAIKEFFPEECARQGLHVTPSGSWNSASFAEYRAAFLQEAELLQRFHHPGIVRVLGVFSENETSYMVAELLVGITLGEGLAAAGPMPQSRILAVAQQVGQALMLIHAAGLVHSDIKPDNLFLTREGRCVILDFGVARGYLSKEAARGAVAALSVGYAPPEQYDPQAKLTPAADVYALAATLYHLLAGFAPSDARQRMQGEPLASLLDLNSTLSPRIENALFAAMDPNPQQRTPGVTEFLEHLGVDTTPRASINASIPELKRVQAQQAHRGGTYVLVLQGDRLYSAGRDGFVRVWSWPDLQIVRGWQAHGQPINTLSVSHDGAYLVTGSAAGEVKLWDAEGVSEAHTLVGPGPGVLGVAFHPQPGVVAAVFADGGCALLGPALPEKVSWGAHVGCANALALHPGGELMATGGDDQRVQLWSLPEGHCASTLSGHTKALQSLQFNRGGDLLLSCSNDLSVKLWDLETRAELRDFRGHRAMVWQAAFTSHRHVIATTSADRCVRTFRIDSSRVTLCSVAHEVWTRALAADPRQPLLATGGGDGFIRVWEIPEL